MRLEKYREAWHQLKPTHSGANGPLTIQAVADETTYAAIPEDNPPADALHPPVILSEGADPQSGSASQSKDPMSARTSNAPTRDFHYRRILTLPL